MSIPFQPQADLIRLLVEVEGPTGRAPLSLALDTAATTTVIASDLLVILGYQPASAPQQSQLVTGSGAQVVPQVTISKLSALGQDRIDFPVLAHIPPSQLRIDGVLGLDFVRGQTLKIDFRTGLIDLT